MSTAPRAYRYARFSHSRQAEGVSLERQADAAGRWAAQHGMEIDDTLAAFIDDGVSGFRGKNILRGALARFLTAVKARDVAPGSYLLIESVSRFSRLVPRLSAKILETLVSSGIRVVFLDTGMEYNASTIDNLSNDVVFRVTASAAAEYARTLKGYKLDSWKRKRDGMRADGTPATRMLPYWLKCEKLEDGGRGPLYVDPVYGRIVETIFREYVRGKGKGTIAALLNNGSTPPPARVGTDKRASMWGVSLIARTLASRAVCGEFQPCVELDSGHVWTLEDLAAALKRKRAASGEPIADYYPRVISEEMWAQAAQMRQANQAKAGAKMLVSSRGAQAITHSLAHLAACPVCERSMKRVNKGRGGAFYICSTALSGKRGACQRVYVPVADVEKALIENAQALGTAAPGADPAVSEAVAAGAAELAKVRAAVAGLTDKVVELFERGETVSDAMNAAHTKLETRLRTLEKAQIALESAAAASTSNVIRQRVANLVSALKHAFDVQDMNAALFECFARVVVDYRSGELVMHWRHGPPPTRVRYF